MKLYCWDQIDREQLNPQITRQVIHTEHLTICRISLAKGSVVPLHRHVSEQVTMLESGRLRFLLDGQEVMLEAGQALQIPSDVPHQVHALEDSVAVDVFTPVREDWIRGDDAYLRRG